MKQTFLVLLLLLATLASNAQVDTIFTYKHTVISEKDTVNKEVSDTFYINEIERSISKNNRPPIYCERVEHYRDNTIFRFKYGNYISVNYRTKYIILSNSFDLRVVYKVRSFSK